MHNPLFYVSGKRPIAGNFEVEMTRKQSYGGHILAPEYKFDSLRLIWETSPDPTPGSRMNSQCREITQWKLAGKLDKLIFYPGILVAPVPGNVCQGGISLVNE